MSIERIARGAWEFVVGDDWRVALGIVAMIATTAGLEALGVPAWWLAPVATIAILYRSVKRVRRSAVPSRRGSWPSGPRTPPP
jgi:hypothetical protein